MGTVGRFHQGPGHAQPVPKGEGGPLGCLDVWLGLIAEGSPQFQHGWVEGITLKFILSLLASAKCQLLSSWPVPCGLRMKLFLLLEWDVGFF